MKTTVYCGVSLDGFLARPDGSVDFLEAFDPPVTEDGEPDDLGFVEFLASVDVLVMGRNTFDFVMDSGFDWPYGDTPVVVLTSRHLEIPAALAELVEPASLEPAELLDVLSSRFIEHVYLDGGYTVQSFLRAGLVDEIITTTVPILIGGGIALFGSLPDDQRFELIGSHATSNGFVQSHYRRER
jgi:dihydrofolate reductase